MGRGFGFFALGLSVGLLAAGLVSQVAKKQKARRPRSIRAKIANRLDVLERQFSQA